MGATCASGLTALPSHNSSLPIKVLILGKQTSGKTFLLYCWKYGIDSIISVEPTSHFNVETVASSSGQRYLVYDVAGNIGHRLRPFLDGTNGVVYMLGTRGDNFCDEDEENYIVKLLTERDLENAVMLFVIRDGSDTVDCLQDLSSQIRDALDGKIWDIMEMKPNSQDDADHVLDVLEGLLTKSKCQENK